MNRLAGDTQSPLAIDLASAIIVASPNLTGAAAKAVVVLTEEIEKRTRIELTRAHDWPGHASPVIAIGLRSALDEFGGSYVSQLADDGDDAPEGYRIQVRTDGQGPAILIVGNDARGLLYGVGHLLRTLRMERGSIRLDTHLDLTTAPHYPLRGHQLGYRDKTNSYCSWDLPQWDEYIRDMVIFGANAIELIPPRSDDNADSVHFPLPPLRMMKGMSQLADDYDVDVWIWFPAMDEDYTDPATVEFALNEWNEVFELLPRIDNIFVPGGDPGQTQPGVLLAMLEKQAEQLRRTHPDAKKKIDPAGRLYVLESAWFRLRQAAHLFGPPW